MDNIATQTMKFLFVPEATLAVLFLLIFLILFGVGIYWAKKCRKSIEYLRDNAESEYEKVREKMSPELFIKKYLMKISATEGKLEGVPEAFVSIGIVATFLGLGVAIQGSAELLQDEKLELAKLTAVLGVIAFKFQTSVWGICFSLIFRSLIVERYFDFKQEVLDYVSDLLYTIERESIRTLLERQNEFLAAQEERQRKADDERAKIQKAQHETLLTENRQLFTSLLETIIEQHEENLRESQRVSKLYAEKADDFKNSITFEMNRLFNMSFGKIEELEKNLRADNAAALNRLNYLTNNFNAFVDTVKTFTDYTNLFIKTSQEFLNHVDTFKIDLTDTLNNGFSNLTASNEELGKLQEKHIEEIHSQHELNIFHVTEKLDELHQKFYLDAKRYVEYTQHKLGDLLADTLDKVNDGYIREAGEIRATIQRLNEILPAIEGNVNRVTEEFINRQNQFVNEWRNVTEAVTDTLERVSRNTAENSNQAVQTYKDLQAITISMQGVNAENAKNLTSIMVDTSKRLDETFNKMNYAVTNNLANLSNVQKTATENLKALTVDTTQKFTESLQAMQTVVENMFGELSKLNAVIERNTPKIDPNLRRLPNLQEGNPKLSNNSKSGK